MFERNLVRAINSGRCFVLVGSGPSCEIGLPSWRKLAIDVISLLDLRSHSAIIKHCQILLDKKEYAAIFSQIEKAIGSTSLLEYVADAFPHRNSNSAVYSYLARWPFAVYLTTNFDDCLSQYLKKEGLAYPTRHNSYKDFLTLRNDSKGVIYKIHGDCSTPNDIVLTSEQYMAFRESSERTYWREKIRSLLHWQNLVLIGYSASDPDFKDQLVLAKELASPNHPIFMFATEIQTNEIMQYFLEYNICIIPYNNPDGDHRELHRVLRRYDPFIAKRGTPHLGQDPINEDKANLASSIYLFTRLNLSGGNDTCLKKSYEALIVNELSNRTDGSPTSLSDLHAELANRIGIRHLDPLTYQAAIESLQGRGYINCNTDLDHCSLTASGHEKLEETREERILREEKFVSSCQLFLQKEYPAIDTHARNNVIHQLQNGLVRAFEKRGLEMAQATFGQNLIDLSTATDILDVVNKQSETILDDDVRAAYADLMLEVLLQPSQEMKERIADLSQGYFSYHALGYDPNCRDERLRMAQSKDWILDSSIILPALAQGCVNHEYAQDLLCKMKAQDFKLVTTDRLLKEVIDHAYWAINNFNDTNTGWPQILQAASGGPGYKQNLFIDGYAKWASRQGVSSLESYFQTIIGKEYHTKVGDCLKERIVELGIEVVVSSDWPDFLQEQHEDSQDIKDKIIELRRQRGTYRNDEQCISEAEVLILCEKNNAVFLSQSSILDSVNRDTSCITWKPESMYRFLSTFSSAQPSDNLLFQSVVQDFYYSGFDIVDYDVLKQLFAEPVRQTHLKLDEEQERHEQALGSTVYREVRSKYDDIPDIQKPFYSIQLGFLIARKEIERRKAAEVRARRSEETTKLTDKERSELMHYRSKEAEKKRKGKQIHRRQQSKNKKGKRRKK